MTARVADGARRRLGLGLLAGALLPGVATRAAAMPGPDVRPDHASPGPRRWRAPLMGTVVTVLVDHPDVARREAALQAAWARMHAQADRLSRFRATSLVSQLAREAGGAPLPVHPEDLPVLQRAVTLARLSGGRFDASVGAYADWDFTPVPGRGSTAGAPRRPDAATLRRQRAFVDPRALEIDAQAGTARLRRAGMRLDLGGVAKLPILLTGLRTLQAHGVGDALIDGGGDVLCSGRCGGRPWRVGLRDPLAPQHLRGALDLPGAACWWPRATTNAATCRTGDAGTTCWIRAAACPRRACTACCCWVRAPMPSRRWSGSTAGAPRSWSPARRGPPVGWAPAVRCRACRPCWQDRTATTGSTGWACA